MVAADVHPGAEPWHWLCLLRSLLRGDSCSSCDALQVKRTPSISVEKLPLPVTALRTSGEGGPDAAAWLLNEHGPALRGSCSPETCGSVRQTLQQAWRELLRLDGGGELQAFVQLRREQLPEALDEAGLDKQVELALEALARAEEEEESESGERSPRSPARQPGTGERPYGFLPSDWARLSESYQVDFVLHGLPGTMNQFCEFCGCAGHVHSGPREPGVDLCLHVGWRGKSSGAGGRAGAGGHSATRSEPEAELSPERASEPRLPLDGAAGRAAAGRAAAAPPATWGRWEPLGSGPIAPRSATKEVAGSDAGSCDQCGRKLSRSQAGGSPPASGEAGGVTVEARGWTTLVSFSCVPTNDWACSSVGTWRGEAKQPRLFGSEKCIGLGALQVLDGCPAPAPCPSSQEPCPPVRACQICPLGAERPHSDDFLASEVQPPSPLPLPAPDAPVGQETQEASLAVEASATPGLVPVVRLERSLTRDDWPIEEPLSPPCTPGQKGYVDTGAGVLAFLLDEAEPPPRTPERPPAASQPHSPCAGATPPRSPSRSNGSRGASPALAAIQELPATGASGEPPEAHEELN